jgi:AcrR family transcriptional regulator
MSATASATPLTPAAASTRAAIIDSAERLFRTLGYQKTTVADIARELRMSPANVYRFFPSKAAINEAICARLLARLDEAVLSVAHGPGSPAERLRAVFRLLQEQTRAMFFEQRRMHDMVAAALEENWPIVAEHICVIDGAFRHIIVEGQTQGVFSRLLDPDEAARALHATCAVFTHPVLVEHCESKNDDLAAIAARMAEFALRALRPD